jgi:hypothetical protein
MRCISWILSASLLLQGCFYSIKLEPPLPTVDVPARAPLGLTIRYGTLAQDMDGEAEKPSQRDLHMGQQVFEIVQRDLGLFSVVGADAPAADLYWDERYHASVPTGAKVVAFLYGLTFGLTAFLLPLPFPYYVNFDWEADVRTQVEGQPAVVRTYRKRFETKLLSMTVWGPLVRRDQVDEHLGSYLGAAVREQVYADYDVYAGLVPVLRNGSPADVRRFLAEHPTRNAAAP